MENAQTAANSAQAVANINKEVLDCAFSSVATFTFDKQTSGRDTFNFNGFNYYKISDFNPAPEDVISFKGTTESGADLSGIITDGDLRRWMSPDLISEKVSKVMTKNPKTISPDALIAEAVNVMNNTGRGITNLFVVKGTKPIGLIHIHDCLRAGAS